MKGTWLEPGSFGPSKVPVDFPLSAQDQIYYWLISSSQLASVTEISAHPLSAKVEIKTKLDNVFMFDLVEVKFMFNNFAKDF